MNISLNKSFNNKNVTFTNFNESFFFEKKFNKQTFNNKINFLNNFTLQCNQYIQNLDLRIYQNRNIINNLRKQAAEYYENKINSLLYHKSITIITSLKPILLNKNNLIMINSSYPGFSFCLLDYYVLSDYYNYNCIEELDITVNQFIKAINNNDNVFKFPQAKLMIS